MTVQKCIGPNVRSVSGGNIDIYGDFTSIFICKNIFTIIKYVYLLVSATWSGNIATQSYEYISESVCCSALLFRL